MFLKIFSTTLLLAQIPNNVNESSCTKFSSTYCISQPSVPVVKVSDKCPSGFFANGGYCFPLTEDVMGVIPIYDGKLPDECPIGYRNNRGYCQSSPKLKTNGIPLIGKKCPRGYLRNKSFCFKNCKKDDRK